MAMSQALWMSMDLVNRRFRCILQLSTLSQMTRFWHTLKPLILVLPNSRAPDHVRIIARGKSCKTHPRKS